MSGREACEHVWSDAYVCTLCGGIKYASAPLWVACLNLKSGPRIVLLALWSFADWHTDSPRPISPENATIRERCGGIKESTLREHISTLKALGWIRVREGRRRSIDLAWIRPYPPGSQRSTDGIPAPAEDPAPPESQRDTAGISAGDRRNASAEPPESRPPYTSSDLVDFALDEASQKRARDTVADVAIDAVLLDRHREHAERQARLEAEREANRAEMRKRAARSELSAEIVAAVGEAGALWVRELETGRSDGRPTWLDDLASAVVELRLTAADVLRVLRAWDEAEAALGGPLAVARLPATGGVMPPRRGVWWTAWRPWVAAQLGVEAPAARQREQGRGSLSVGWPSNTTSSRRSFVKPKEVAQA